MAELCPEKAAGHCRASALSRAGGEGRGPGKGHSGEGPRWSGRGSAGNPGPRHLLAQVGEWESPAAGRLCQSQAHHQGAGVEADAPAVLRSWPLLGVTTAAARGDPRGCPPHRGDGCDRSGHGELVLPSVTTDFAAARVPPSGLRLVDALHLANALEIRADLEEIVVTDLRLKEAAGRAAVLPSPS